MVTAQADEVPDVTTMVAAGSTVITEDEENKWFAINIPQFNGDPLNEAYGKSSDWSKYRDSVDILFKSNGEWVPIGLRRRDASLFGAAVGIPPLQYWVSNLRR